MLTLLDRIKGHLGYPCEEYVQETLINLIHKAEQHPGHIYTAHFGLRHSASVVVPKKEKS